MRLAQFIALLLSILFLQVDIVPKLEFQKQMLLYLRIFLDETNVVLWIFNGH